MKPESPAPWLLFFVVLGCALLVSMLSGCASQRYTAAVQVIEKDVAFQVSLEGVE